VSSRLALLVGVALSLAGPMPSRADEPASPAELWRAYPLRPNAHDAVSGGTAGGQVGMGGPAVVDPDGDGADAAADSRLILQLGMLFAFLYVAFLCVWYSTTRHLRAVTALRGLRLALQRVRASWAAPAAAPGQIARARSVAQPASFTPATANSMWTCEIAWQPGQVRSRFQAVMAPPDSRTRRVVAESEGLRWPPEDVRKPPTRELEAALGALVASIVGAGWEAVQCGGSWSERRFVWRREGVPPTTLELVGEEARKSERHGESLGIAAAGEWGKAARQPSSARSHGRQPASAGASRSRPSPSPARSQRSRRAAGPSLATPAARQRAPRGANREAVLRVVAERPGVTTRELVAASGVKRGSLSALLRTLTQRGDLEKCALPGGQTGYALAASAASGEQPPAEPGASTPTTSNSCPSEAPAEASATSADTDQDRAGPAQTEEVVAPKQPEADDAAEQQPEAQVKA